LHTPAGTPGRLLRLAASGSFRAVICSDVLGEVVRNLDRKVGSHEGLDQIVAAGLFEVMPNPTPLDVEPWAARGFGTDSTVIAASLASEVDALCTGDRYLIRELPAYSLPFDVLNPRGLLDLLT
jgi:hypothetical protein